MSTHHRSDSVLAVLHKGNRAANRTPTASGMWDPEVKAQPCPRCQQRDVGKLTGLPPARATCQPFKVPGLVPVDLHTTSKYFIEDITAVQALTELAVADVIKHAQSSNIQTLQSKI